MRWNWRKTVALVGVTLFIGALFIGMYVLSEWPYDRKPWMQPEWPFDLGGARPERPTPEQQRFLDKYDAIQKHMSEVEVDAIMAGHRRSKSVGGGTLFDLPIVTHTVTYEEPSALEGDLLIEVYFDAGDHAVHKLISAWIR
jgi:hypothetical protein